MKNAYFVSGSIACGKSSFLKIANSLGFKSLSADLIAHQILEQNSEKILELFKDPNLIENGKINRLYLGDLIFNDKNLKEKLESFMHPRIRTEIFERMQKLEPQNKAFFIELPLFFESDAYKNLGKSVLIYADKEQSLKRLMQRNALSKEQALARINSQMDIEKKLALADFVIKNTSTYENFHQECVKFLIKLKEKSENL